MANIICIFPSAKTKTTIIPVFFLTLYLKRQLIDIVVIILSSKHESLGSILNNPILISINEKLYLN